MLPDIRAVVAAIFAAIALLAISFGVAATFRVAQESSTGPLQADLAQRTRTFVPASGEQRTVLLIDTPAPLEPVPVSAVEVKDAPDIPPPVEIAAAPQAEPAPPPEPAVQPSAAEPPLGGPLKIVAARSEEPVDRAAVRAAEKERAKRAAAKKARAARERIARQRKAAARRAAEARAKQQASSFNNNSTFGNSFGGFGDQTFRQ
jgi:type IV secretory pathway VirB10-like protein